MAFIIDAKTPSCCYNCPCYDGMDGSSRCQAADKDVMDGDARPEWCPICGEVYISSRDENGNPNDTRVSIILDQMIKSLENTPDKWERIGIGTEVPSDISDKKLRDIRAVVCAGLTGDKESVIKIRDILDRKYDEEE